MYHLAEFNIAKAKYPLSHPEMDGFTKGLTKINALAESSPGFVWRLKDDANDNALAFNVFGDEKIIINLSVWENLESLKAFTFNSEHLSFMKKRHAWFEMPKKPYLVLWWIRQGEIPTVTQAKDKLEHLEKKGATEKAFTFREIFPCSEV